MKCWRLDDAGALIECDRPRPLAGPGEVLIRVHAAGVIPTERGWYPTLYTKDGMPRRGAVPCHEFSGVVEGTGAEVFGMNDWFMDGAMAEYVVAPESAVASKPASLSHVEAASVPVSALTAWQGLFDRGKLAAGERLLIHGGAGSVGLFAVQLGRRHGAHVIATASAANLDFVMQLGAHEVIDYRAQRFEDAARDVDLVFDTVGGETLQRSPEVLKPDGRIVTIVSTEKDFPGFFIVEPNRTQLSEIAVMLDAGTLRTYLDTVVPFSQAAAAFGGKLEHRAGRGKIVVQMETE